jgi:CRISPR-associated protein Cas5t
MARTFWLHIRAPFAAFRGFQAGVFRSTSPVMPPSAAYGLVLNLAGIEMRGSLDGVATSIRPDVPRLRIAIGVVHQPGKSSIYQQLHSYPVGNSGKEFAGLTHGAKYWIVPVRRELLVDYEGLIGVQASDEGLRAQVARGLCGDLETRRYGLPFAGDNNYLFDNIEIVDQPPSGVLWYSQLQPNSKSHKGTCRLTVGIDRADNSKTTSFIYAPTPTLSEAVWTWVPKEPATVG